MEFGFTTAAYVVAAILFILALGGLSGQESAFSIRHPAPACAHVGKET